MPFLRNIRGIASTLFAPRPPRTERTAPLTRAQILARLDDLPISEWRYDWDPDSLHLGPMAQDWWAAFGYGRRDTTIMPVDAQGVLIAAVQELSRRVRELEAQQAPAAGTLGEPRDTGPDSATGNGPAGPLRDGASVPAPQKPRTP
ncbi:tail fiber domain-containing protein [Streptomyces tsukubensis]|uniref:tail fiber domain-containing protein n=1 Tax=Streptomyces tsukubensis TaxID=83656 RepID=UPI00344CAB31